VQIVPGGSQRDGNRPKVPIPRTFLPLQLDKADPYFQRLEYSSHACWKFTLRVARVVGPSAYVQYGSEIPCRLHVERLGAGYLGMGCLAGGSHLVLQAPKAFDPESIDLEEA